MIALVVVLLQLGAGAPRLLRRGNPLFADDNRADPDIRRRWARALDLQTPAKPLFLTQKHSKCYLLATPDVELLVSVLKSDDVANNLYVGMVTFQPGSGRCISELQGVEL